MLVEIYELENSKDLIWNNEKTYLCVYDDQGNQIADYDFFTGLRLLSRNNQICVYIFDSEVIPGKWTFFASLSKKQNGQTLSIDDVEVSGESFGIATKRIYKNENPWSSDIVPFASASQREGRMEVCRKCPMFDKNGMCNLDNTLAIQKTKIRFEACPDEKWGSKSEVQEFRRSTIIIDNNGDSQVEFEKKFEEFLRGSNDQ